MGEWRREEEGERKKLKKEKGDELGRVREKENWDRREKWKRRMNTKRENEVRIERMRRRRERE